MNRIENIIDRYRRHKTRCELRRAAIDQQIVELEQERRCLRNPHWTEGLVRPVMREIARRTPEITWQIDKKLIPVGLRGMVTVIGVNDDGNRIEITFTEQDHQLHYDTGDTASRYPAGAAGDGLNNLTAPVGDGEALLEYIRKLNSTHRP